LGKQMQHPYRTARSSFNTGTGSVLAVSEHIGKHAFPRTASAPAWHAAQASEELQKRDCPSFAACSGRAKANLIKCTRPT
jgi:hypothetical protein